MKGGVYLITNTITRGRYVGSSINVDLRVIQHKSDLKCQRHSNIILQRSYNKYGIEAFKFERLISCPSEYTIKLEQWFINTFKPEYNIAKVAGANNIGIKMKKEYIIATQETKIKNGVHRRASIRMQGNKYSQGSRRTKEQIDKLQKAKKDKYCKSINQLSLTREVLDTFNTAVDAAKAVGCSYKSIHRVCIGLMPTCKGYKWEYV